MSATLKVTSEHWKNKIHVYESICVTSSMGKSSVYVDNAPRCSVIQRVQLWKGNNGEDIVLQYYWKCCIVLMNGCPISRAHDVEEYEHKEWTWTRNLVHYYWAIYIYLSFKQVRKPKKDDRDTCFLKHCPLAVNCEIWSWSILVFQSPQAIRWPNTTNSTAARIPRPR